MVVISTTKIHTNSEKILKNTIFFTFFVPIGLKIYSQDLINNLFRHPYTKIDFVRNELNVSKPTAIAYLNQLCECQNPFLQKIKIGRENYYVNTQLFNLLQNAFQAR